MTRESKIAMLTAIIVIAFVFACMFYYYQAFYEHLEFPRSTFLMVGLFGDFVLPYQQWNAGQFNSVGYGMSYFPGTYLFVALLAKLPTANIGAEVYLTAFSAFVFAYSYSRVKTGNVAASIRDGVICTFMAYPFLFILTTGNLEGLLFVALALFALAYASGRYELSAVFLAYAISMKLYPAALLVVYLANRRYRGSLYAALWTAAFTLVPLLVFHGGILDGISGYLSRLHQSQMMYADLMIMSVAGDHFGHSLINGTRMLLGAQFPPMQNVLAPYLIFAATCFVCVTVYITVFERTLWKQIALLTIAICVLPPTSTDYKLMLMFIPLYMLINDRAEASSVVFERLFMTLFALLVIPKPGLYLRGDPYSMINEALNPLIMLALATLIIVDTLRTRHGGAVSVSHAA